MSPTCIELSDMPNPTRLASDRCPAPPIRRLSNRRPDKTAWDGTEPDMAKHQVEPIS
jgi:hypothetical protein